jgi:hypothetical protein
MGMADPKDGSVPVVPSLLWALFCLVMWFWAIVGPLTVALAVASYFADLGGFLSMPRPEAIGLGGTLGVVGVTFVYLRIGRHVRFRGELVAQEATNRREEVRR